MKVLKFFRFLYHNKIKSYYVRYAITKLYNLYGLFHKGSRLKYYFPLTIDGRCNLIGKAMFEDDNGFAYYTQYYSEPFFFLTKDKRSAYLYKTEIYKAKIYNTPSINYKSQVEDDCVLPVSIINKHSYNKIDNENLITVRKNSETIRLANLAQNRFHYLRFNKGDNISISSKKDILIGRPLALHSNNKNNKKLVLSIFVDAFSASLFKEYSYEELIPNTYNFFKKGLIFNNCYSNGESTITSLSSMFSGKYAGKNNFFHPRKRQVLGVEQKTISQYFQDQGYFTQLISGNYGQNPYQGYCIGFDRTIFKNSLRHNEIIHEFLDSMRVFKDREVFTWFSFLDIHHNLGISPDFSSGADLDICDHDYRVKDRVKSPFRGFSSADTARYISEIKRMDYNMQILYSYIESNFCDDEILISLVSDHGNSISDKSNKIEILRKEKLNVPFMVRGASSKPKISDEVVENVDMLAILLKHSGIEYDNKEIDGTIPRVLGGKGKDFIFSESIYPNQTYKATIKDSNYEAFFETNDYVSQAGEVDLSNYAFKVYGIESGLLVNDESLIDEYKIKLLSKLRR